MSPELLSLLADLGSTGVLIWVVLRQSDEIKAMREEAKADRQQLWQLLSFLIRENDSRADIPTLPSQRAQ